MVAVRLWGVKMCLSSVMSLSIVEQFEHSSNASILHIGCLGSVINSSLTLVKCQSNTHTKAHKHEANAHINAIGAFVKQTSP